MKKRKFIDITEQMNCKTEYKHLRIQKILSLPCEICQNPVPVENFNMCISGHVYCSEDCFEIILLSYKNDYLDVDY